MSSPTLDPLADPNVPANVFAAGQIMLRPRKARPFFGRHPWVLDSAVDRIEGQPNDGDIVDLLSDKGKFIARGLYNSQSRIRVRLYTWADNEAVDEAFWRLRMQHAIDLRRQLNLLEPQGAARLVFSEADGLSGLVVDRYADYLSIQATSLGISQRLPMLAPMLTEMTRARGILLRHEKGTAQSEGLAATEGCIFGQAPTGPIFITEHELKYGIDLVEGQKTGFYLDQRENRRAAAQYMGGRKLLDVCCYSGGFSLNACKWGDAREVVGFDTSAKAVALARANAELNGIANARFEPGDCFQTLQALVEGRQKFEAVVLDPPKFARSRQSVDEALRAYHRLNRLAVDVLRPGGILVTCSCSGHVSREDMLYLMAGVSQQTGRDVQVLEQRGAAADHPISAACLETEYLKCLICRVL